MSLWSLEAVNDSLKIFMDLGVEAIKILPRFSIAAINAIMITYSIMSLVFLAHQFISTIFFSPFIFLVFGFLLYGHILQTIKIIVTAQCHVKFPLFLFCSSWMMVQPNIRHTVVIYRTSMFNLIVYINKNISSVACEK